MTLVFFNRTDLAQNLENYHICKGDTLHCLIAWLRIKYELQGGIFSCMIVTAGSYIFPCEVYYTFHICIFHFFRFKYDQLHSIKMFAISD